MRVFYDTSVILYASACIGYRWAVKLLEIAARRRVCPLTDVLMPLEILELHDGRERREKGIQIVRALQPLFSEVESIRDEDFLASAELSEKFPGVNPRMLLRASIMSRIGVKQICATYATGAERLPMIERTNLIEMVES